MTAIKKGKIHGCIGNYNPSAGNDSGCQDVSG